jgi:type IV secretion system protein TrbB
MGDKEKEIRLRRLDALADSMGKDVVKMMNDDNVFEVILNSDGKLWTDTFDKGFVNTGLRMDPDQAKSIIYGVAAFSNNVIDLEKKPYLEAEITESALFGNARFQGELPTIVDAPSFNIRKHSKKIFTLDDYVEQGTMTLKQRDIILQAIRNHQNIIAAGGTKSGKTTLLNAILREISKTQDRIIIIEDTPELQCTAENHENLKTIDPYIDMETLLRISLRKSPTRIVVGEVRNKEALTLLTAWSTGHRGGCSTVHSESAVETLYRLEEMVSQVSLTPQQARIGRAVDIVVYLKYYSTKREIEDIIHVTGYDKEKQDYITEKLD